MGKIRIFDTTLRDGEQTPGVCLELNEKVEIALALEKLGVDVIEAGFPIASPGDFAAVAAVAKAVKTPVVAALARAAKNDIDLRICPYRRQRQTQQSCSHSGRCQFTHCQHDYLLYVQQPCYTFINRRNDTALPKAPTTMPTAKRSKLICKINGYCGKSGKKANDS